MPKRGKKYIQALEKVKSVTPQTFSEAVEMALGAFLLEDMIPAQGLVEDQGDLDGLLLLFHEGDSSRQEELQPRAAG